MTVLALALALLHFLWQGALVAILLAAVHALLPRNRSRARYGAACASLALMLALPVLTMQRLVEEPRTAASTRVGAPPADASGSFDISPAARPSDAYSRLAPAIVALWLSGVGLLSLRAAGGWLSAGRLARRNARPAPGALEERLRAIAARLSVRGRVRLLESLRVAVPCTIGILRPVVLVPAGIATGMTGSQIDALLAHELAHVRRRDFLVNALQVVAETLLFYHPAVWWVSGRIRVERENACDDLAVEATGDPAAYARTLLVLEERRAEGLASRLALAADGGDLWNRVARLLPSAEPPARTGPRPFFAVLFVFVVAGILAAATGASVTTPEAAPTPRSAAQAKTPPATPTTAPLAGHTPPTRGAQSARPGGAKLLSPQQLVSFRIHDVTPEFIDEIEALGYTSVSADDLIALRIHDVSAATIRQMQELFGRVSLEECIAFQIHGVTPAYVREIRALGLSDLGADDAVAFRVHGVTPGFVREIRAQGYTDIDADALVAFRVHGVTPQYIRSMNASAGEKLSSDDLIEGRVLGERPEKNQEE